ncbi:MAG: methylated-DNA--[protein]-cysteine S-methyltransferase [Bacilli bacterium]|nr:methylated-DNA--[protein]-cysteine S-methyltransferase [Bacilli bacterium]MDD4388730.1 methylated-DNA--[protein]-cysteine S-methyltransferase [Bacilli bacterium]
MNKGFAVYKTPYGYFHIMYENDKITALERVSSDIVKKGRATALTDVVYDELREYFAGKRKEFSFPYKLKGTEFQIKVWEALCHIPYGETRSYQDIAIAVGNPKAYRAVGMANNKNPIIIAIPCHRVIGTDGKLIGYGGGIEMKKILLDLEKKNK